MSESHLELREVRCPQCGGDMVLRVFGDERGKDVILTLDSACVACGMAPWSDERTMVFTPGGAPASGEEADGRLAAAQARIETLARRCQVLEDALAAAERNAAREQRSEVESQLRSEISRLEGSLAQARADARKADAATRGEVQPGKRPIEIE